VSVGAPLKNKRQSDRLRSETRQPVQPGLVQAAIGGAAFEPRHKLSHMRIQLKISEVADGHDPVLRAGIRLELADLFRAPRTQNTASIPRDSMVAVRMAQA